VRLTTCKLNDVNAGALPFGAKHGVPIAFNQKFASGHFGHDKAGPEVGYQAAERRIGDPSHRRQHDAIPHCNVADAECGRFRGVAFFGDCLVHAMPIL
jgi:hypothetical protein